MIDQADFAPGTLVDHGGGRYSLFYSAFPDVGDLLERKGLQTGHAWHAMVVHLLEEHAPDALESLDFDRHAKMFCAVSDSLDALRAVAKVLAKLEHRETVADLIENVDLVEYG